MATLIFDLDGTCLRFHTNDWLPGVRERLIELSEDGHQIIFISMRGHRDPNEVWCQDNTKKLLEELPFKYTMIWNSEWPRIVVDDCPPVAVHTPTDSGDWLDKLVRR
jgi:ribonucleotide monophosphatase NagD (HAD superfamily)